MVFQNISTYVFNWTTKNCIARQFFNWFGPIQYDFADSTAVMNIVFYISDIELTKKTHT